MPPIFGSQPHHNRPHGRLSGFGYKPPKSNNSGWWTGLFTTALTVGEAAIYEKTGIDNYYINNSIYANGSFSSVGIRKTTTTRYTAGYTNNNSLYSLNNTSTPTVAPTTAQQTTQYQQPQPQQTTDNGTQQQPAAAGGQQPQQAADDGQQPQQAADNTQGDNTSGNWLYYAVEDLDADGKTEKLYTGLAHNKYLNNDNDNVESESYTKNITGETYSEEKDKKQKIQDAVKLGKADGSSESEKTGNGYPKYITLTDKDSDNQYTYVFSTTDGCEGLSVKYKLDKESSSINNNYTSMAEPVVTISLDEANHRILFISNETNYSATQNTIGQEAEVENQQEIIDGENNDDDDDETVSENADTMSSSTIASNIKNSIKNSGYGKNSIKTLSDNLKTVTADNIVEILTEYDKNDPGEIIKDITEMNSLRNQHNNSHTKPQKTAAREIMTLLNKLYSAAKEVGVNINDTELSSVKHGNTSITKCLNKEEEESYDNIKYSDIQKSKSDISKAINDLVTKIKQKEEKEE